MHAWLCENPVGPEALVWKELPTPEPQGSEVLIEVTHCGVCHSDLHIVKNDLGNTTYPIVPGHEIAGVVTPIRNLVTIAAAAVLLGTLIGPAGLTPGGVVLELVGRLHAERGRTVAVVLHDLNLAAAYCDDLVLLDRGRVAGSGTDAAPYFRIFNPELQAKKFDPDGRYVREWAPEAAEREPIVDLAASRKAALAAYEAVKHAG